MRWIWMCIAIVAALPAATPWKTDRSKPCTVSITNPLKPNIVNQSEPRVVINLMAELVEQYRWLNP